MGKSICRIGKNTEFHAYAYDKNKKCLASIFDSGYTSLRQIFKRLSEKSSGWLKPIDRIEVVDLTNQVTFHYKRHNGKMVRVDFF